MSESEAVVSGFEALSLGIGTGDMVLGISGILVGVTILFVAVYLLRTLPGDEGAQMFSFLFLVVAIAVITTSLLSIGSVFLGEYHVHQEQVTVNDIMHHSDTELVMELESGETYSTNDLRVPSSITTGDELYIYRYTNSFPGEPETNGVSKEPLVNPHE